MFFGKKIGRLSRSCLPRRANAASSKSQSQEGCCLVLASRDGTDPKLKKQERRWERWGPKLGPMEVDSGGGTHLPCSWACWARSHSSTLFAEPGALHSSPSVALASGRFLSITISKQ